MSYPVPPPYYGPPPSHGPTQAGTGLAISAMTCGIIALLLSWVPYINIVAGLLALIAIGLGIPALVVGRRGGGSAQAFAITGLVTAAVALVLVLLVTAAVAGQVGDTPPSSSAQPATPAASAPQTADDQGEPVGGAARPLPVGRSAEVSEYLVTVDAVMLDGNDLVADANRFNDPPAGQYVVVTLTVTYVGQGEGDPWLDLEEAFVGADSRIYRDSACWVTLPSEAHDVPTLLPGGSASFQACMDVPPTAIDGGTLFVEGSSSLRRDERRYWALQ